MTRSIASEGRPTRFVLSVNWDLRPGKGWAFGSGAPAAVNGMISGWTVSGVYTVQAGSPAETFARIRVRSTRRST